MNFTLIGMPGAGKSTLGKKIAEALQYRFIDIDALIEKKEGLKIPQVLAKAGEKRFLELEEKAVLSLDITVNCIISPGGSIVYLGKAMEFLKNNSKIIFLDAPLSLIKTRLKEAPRGIVGLQKSLEKLHSERQMLYQKYADATMKISENSDSGQAAQELLKLVKSVSKII